MQHITCESDLVFAFFKIGVMSPLSVATAIATSTQSNRRTSSDLLSHMELAEGTSAKASATALTTKSLSETCSQSSVLALDFKDLGCCPVKWSLRIAGESVNLPQDLLALAQKAQSPVRPDTSFRSPRHGLHRLTVIRRYSERFSVERRAQRQN